MYVRPSVCLAKKQACLFIQYFDVAEFDATNLKKEKKIHFQQL